jgi:hypothetical protein
MKTNYREYLKLNKNLIISFLVALIASAAVAQMFSEEEIYVNSSYTVIVDFTVFYSSFSILFYVDNRKRYRLSDGRTDSKQLKKDLVKIISSLGVGEIIYMATRWYLQYYFLTLEYEPYLASMISHLASTLVYMIAVNLSVKFTRLYKHDT